MTFWQQVLDGLIRNECCTSSCSDEVGPSRYLTTLSQVQKLTDTIKEQLLKRRTPHYTTILTQISPNHHNRKFWKKGICDTSFKLAIITANDSYYIVSWISCKNKSSDRTSLQSIFIGTDINSNTHINSNGTFSLNSYEVRRQVSTSKARKVLGAYL